MPQLSHWDTIKTGSNEHCRIENCTLGCLQIRWRHRAFTCPNPRSLCRVLKQRPYWTELLTLPSPPVHPCLICNQATQVCFSVHCLVIYLSLVMIHSPCMFLHCCGAPVLLIMTVWGRLLILLYRPVYVLPRNLPYIIFGCFVKKTASGCRCIVYVIDPGCFWCWTGQ